MAYHLQAGILLENRYRIGQVIGQGGFGITYQGIDEHIQTKVAIKELFVRAYMGRVEGSTDTYLMDENCRDLFEKAKESFLKEAIIVGIFHQEPGVVTVTDHFRANGTAYIVMEYVEGITLDTYLKEHGAFEAEVLFRAVLPLVRVLGRIHDNEVIHRDISPDNIMMLPDGSMKLLDFGAARQYTVEEGLSQILKDGYAPPEQWNKDGKQGPWTDIYALCAVLYQCLTGKVPESSVQRMFLDELQKPSQLGIAIEPKAERILMKGLEILSEDRYQSMQELYKELRSIVPEPELPDALEQKKKRKNRMLAATVLAAGFVAFVGVYGYRIYKEKTKFVGIETETVLLMPTRNMSAEEYLEAKKRTKARTERFLEGYVHEITEDEDGQLLVRSSLDAYTGSNIYNCFDVFLACEGNTGILWREPESGERHFLPVSGASVEAVVSEGDTLQITVNEVLTEAITAAYAADETIGFAYNYRENESDYVCQTAWNEETHQLILSGGNTMQQARFRDVLAYSLQREPLDTAFSIYEEIPVAWEVPDHSLNNGRNQCKAEEVSDPAILVSFSNDKELYDTIRRADMDYLVCQMTERLDALEIPYALGADKQDQRNLILKLRQEDADLFRLSTLMQKSDIVEIVDLLESQPQLYVDVKTLLKNCEISHMVEADGTLTILFTFENENTIRRVEKYTEKLCRQGEDLYLRFGASYAARCVLNEPVRDGILRFTLRCDEEKTPLTEEDAWLADYLQAFLTEGEITLSYDHLPHRMNYTDSKGNPAYAAETVREETIPNENIAMFRRIRERYPQAERDETKNIYDLSLTVYFSDVDFSEKNWIEKVVQRYLDIYECSEIENRRMDQLTICYLDPVTKDRKKPVMQYCLRKPFGWQEETEADYELQISLFEESVKVQQAELERAM